MTVLVFEKKVVSYSVAFSVMCIYGDPESFFFLSIRELSFRKGDIINVRRQVDKNWIDGELNGRRGIFPQNYVEVDNFCLFLAKAKTRFKGVFVTLTHSSRDCYTFPSVLLFS